MNDLIQIDLGKIKKEKTTDLVISKKGELAKEAENEIKKILAVQDAVEKMLDYVKEVLGKEMDKRKLVKVKGGIFTISKRFFGSRYKLGLGAEEDFKQLVSYDKPNIEAIETYQERTGELPKGIEMRDREQKISILKREEDL